MVRRGPTPPRKGHGRALANAEAGLLSRVLEIVEAARGHAARSVNSAMVHAYWMIGREIVVAEQAGAERAGYGDEVIERLAERLARRLGKGFGARTLWRLRQFYQLYPSGSALGSPESATGILTAPRTESRSRKILTTPRTELASAPAAVFPPNLGWAHYRVLLNVTNDDARAFYEIEAAREGLRLVPADWPRAGEGAAA
jgi:uncharacterized protein DUF1016